MLKVHSVLMRAMTVHLFLLHIFLYKAQIAVFDSRALPEAQIHGDSSFFGRQYLIGTSTPREGLRTQNLGGRKKSTKPMRMIRIT